MCKYWIEGLRNLIAGLTKYRIFFACESRTFHLIYFTHSVWLHITHWLAGPQRSPAASLLWLSVSGLDQKGQRKQHRVFIQGQGHSAGLERTEPSPTRRKATLMKGYAAWRPGYTDHGLIGLMRCSSSWARSGTGGRAGQRRMVGPAGRYGADWGKGFIYLLSFSKIGVTLV